MIDSTKNSAPSTLVVSFSGGRTSAMMARMIQVSPIYEKWEKHYIFANTGKERAETLDFIEECNNRWGLGVIWVEAVVNPGDGNGTTHRVVSRKSAIVNTDPLREGHPFFDVVAKYGLFNNHYPHCTRELKAAPIRSYLRSLGLSRRDYLEAWGIRFDEPRRLAEREGVIFPLAELKITERVVREFWDAQEFDLGIKQYEGNCDLCFKKSLRKRLTILRDNAAIAKDWATIEAMGDSKGGDRARFDRSGLTIQNLLDMSKSPTLERAVDAHDINLTQPELFTAAAEINWDYETACHCQSS